MPTLVIRGPDGKLVERELVGRLTVGCDEDNDLVLRTGGVEKRHANFFADGGEVVLEQLDSSAAQTIVDGEPMKGRRKLVPGVRVLIGGYEVQVKPGKQQLTVRKLSADTLDAEPPSTAKPPATFPFKLVFSLFGIALAVIVAAGVWRRIDKLTPDVAPPPPPTDPCADLEQYLRPARESYTPRALDAVNKVLECDPLHKEANDLLRRIPKEIEGAALTARAREFIELDRDVQALEQLEQIPPGTDAERLARPVLVEVATRVMKQAKKDCDTYLKAGKKAAAEPHCKEAERLKRLLEPPKSDEPKGRSLAERIMDRQPEPLLIEPLISYAGGRYGEAITKLQKIRENNRHAALHAQADNLRKDITNAEALFKIGERALEKGELERAAKAFNDALALDQKLLPEGGSALETGSKRLMAAKAYDLGSIEAQHENWVRACAAWKVGFAFSRGNTDLNRAITNVCTGRAAELLKSERCKDLEDALKLAVDGDDLAPRIQEKLSGLHCKQ